MSIIRKISSHKRASSKHRAGEPGKKVAVTATEVLLDPADKHLTSYKIKLGQNIQNVIKHSVYGMDFGTNAYNSILMSVGMDEEVIFMDYNKGYRKSLISINTPGYKTCCCWEKSKGNFIAFGTGSGEVYVFPAEIAKNSTLEVKAKVALKVHYGLVNSIKFSAENPSTVFTAGVDWSIGVVNVETNEKFKLFGHEADVTSLAVNPNDPQLLVSASVDKTVRIWDLRTNEPELTFEEHLEAVNSVDFLGKSNDFVSGSDDGSCRVFDARSMQELHRFDFAEKFELPASSRVPVHGVLSALNGNLVMCAQDKSARAWDVQTGECFTFSGTRTPDPHACRISALAKNHKETTFATCSIGHQDPIKTWKIKKR